MAENGTERRWELEQWATVAITRVVSGPSLLPGERISVVEEGCEVKRIAEFVRYFRRDPETADAIERGFGGGQHPASALIAEAQVALDALPPRTIVECPVCGWWDADHGDVPTFCPGCIADGRPRQELREAVAVSFGGGQ